MKKRAMKKWIPKNTIYCYDCKWWKFIKVIELNRYNINCPNNDCKDKDKCWTTPSTSCRVKVCRCEYLGYTDSNEDSLLWDRCKECGVSTDFIEGD